MSHPGKIKVITAQMEFPLCPTLITGTTDVGATVHARYRWGRLSIRLDPRDPAPHNGAEGDWIMERQLDADGIDSCLSYNELREITADIVEWPDELTPKTHDDSDTWP